MKCCVDPIILCSDRINPLLCLFVLFRLLCSLRLRRCRSALLLLLHQSQFGASICSSPIHYINVTVPMAVRIAHPGG